MKRVFRAAIGLVLTAVLSTAIFCASPFVAILILRPKGDPDGDMLSGALVGLVVAAITFAVGLLATVIWTLYVPIRPVDKELTIEPQNEENGE